MGDEDLQVAWLPEPWTFDDVNEAVDWITNDGRNRRVYLFSPVIDDYGDALHQFYRSRQFARAGVQTIPVPAFVTDMLAEYLARFPAGVDGLIFTIGSGSPGPIGARALRSASRAAHGATTSVMSRPRRSSPLAIRGSHPGAARPCAACGDAGGLHAPCGRPTGYGLGRRSRWARPRGSLGRAR